jgi:hypothetical protein
MKHHLAVLSAFLFELGLRNADAAESFSENFSKTTLDSHLVTAPGYVFGSNATPVGTAQKIDSSASRSYIATTATDFNKVDFVFEITATVHGPTATQIAFIGMGSGVPDPDFFTEPSTSVYFRLFPNDFEDGALTLCESSTPGAPSAHPAEMIVSRPPHPGEGTHRVQFRKVGNVLTMSCEVDSAGGPFVADYTVSRNIPVDLPFLNSSNSRLFFGVQGANTTFGNLTVRVVRLPALVWAVLGIIAVACVVFLSIIIIGRMRGGQRDAEAA